MIRLQKPIRGDDRTVCWVDNASINQLTGNKGFYTNRFVYELYDPRDPIVCDQAAAVGFQFSK